MTWHFADHHDPAYEPPEIVSGATKPHDYSMMDRHPFIYNEGQNKLYVGDKGTHHWNLHNEFDLPANSADDSIKKGYAWRPRAWSASINWYQDPMNKAIVNQALNDHLQLGLPDDEWDSPEDDWGDLEHLGRVAADLDDFKHWWNKEKPFHSYEAVKMAEYAAAEKLSRDEAEDWLQDHKKDIKDDYETFKKSFLRKFDRLDTTEDIS